MGPRTEAVRGGACGVDGRAARRRRVERHRGAAPRVPRARRRPWRRGRRPRAHVRRDRERAALHAARSPSSATSSRPSDPNLSAAAVERCLTPAHARGDRRALLRLSRRPRPAARALRRRAGSRSSRTPPRRSARELEPGRQAGTVGALGCLSFFSKKQLCVGEGGAVLTADRRARRARPVAALARDDLGHVGSPTRPRGVLRRRRRRLQLPARRAAGRARARRACRGCATTSSAAARRSGATARRLAGTPGADADVDGRGRRAQLALRVPGPDRRAGRSGGACARLLGDRGIQTTRYPVLHSFTELASLAAPGSLPAAEAAADRHLALPLSSHQDDDSDRPRRRRRARRPASGLIGRRRAPGSRRWRIDSKSFVACS